jgi:hypothetical protein
MTQQCHVHGSICHATQPNELIDRSHHIVFVSYPDPCRGALDAVKYINFCQIIIAFSADFADNYLFDFMLSR